MPQYRDYGPAGPLLIGYDPYRDLPENHLARLIDRVVDEAIEPGPRQVGTGQPAFDPRLCVKVLVYSYATGIRSSRQMERFCRESLPFLYLTRGDGPSYRTLCTVRVKVREEIELVWQALFAVGQEAGLVRMGRLVIDTTKLRANASPESVLRQSEYDAVREELKRILDENEALDAREQTDGSSMETTLPKSVPHDHLRDHVRRVRQRLNRQKRDAAAEEDKANPSVALAPDTHGGPDDTPASVPDVVAESEGSQDEAAAPVLVLAQPLSVEMQSRIEQAIDAIDAAKADGRKHLCLTDPDARMMPEGRSKKLRECHALEVAVDKDAGLIVAAGVTTESDNARTVPLIEAARAQEPDGIRSVDGDSGMWRGDDIAYLEGLGIDTCIPDSNTACDLHRGLRVGTTLARRTGTTHFTYDAEKDCYWCPQGSQLVFIQERRKEGQTVREYCAKRQCSGCPMSGDCLRQKGAKHRYLKVSLNHDLVAEVLARFDDAEHQQRYHNRAKAIETIFGFLRSVLGYTHWLLRGSDRVACEATLFKTAYQIRKVHTALTGASPRRVIV